VSDGRRRLLIATGSRHKFAELCQVLDLPATDVLALDDLDLTDSATEDGSSFEENARLKALHYARLSGLPTLADDSGLEVDALDGRPGVWTRRYAGPTATDQENNALLLSELDGMGVAPAERTSRYRCVLVLADGDEVLETSHGSFEGRIAPAPRGSGGFGYDPIFEPASEPVGGRTVGQLTTREKNAISHRATAARAMRERLVARGY
jgi:XTP/dITP diphosphohydrolase